jgi:hypothetical protein
MNNTEKTLGEKRVRTSFNPSDVDTVAQLKQKSGEIINLLEELKIAKITEGEDILQKGEFLRLIHIAQTSYEEAAMWAVKAATY